MKSVFSAGHAARLGFVLMILGEPSVHAQTASQLTPPSFAPAPPSASRSSSVPASTGAVTPKGADALTVQLADIVIEGDTVAPAVLAGLKARLVERKASIAQIFDAVRALEAGYAARGMVLKRVVVPAQKLVDGSTLRLVIVDGSIDRVDVANVPPRVRRRVAAIMAPLIQSHGPSLAKMERRLLLASDVPGLAMRSTLAAGSKPGTTILVIDATFRPVTGFVTLGNPVSGSLGRYSAGLGLDLNSPLGLGETIYARASGLPNTGRETSFLDSNPRNRSLAGGAILPLGANGVTINLEYADSRTAPRHSLTSPGIGSTFRRKSARLRYPLLRSRSITMVAEASFDAQDEQVAIIDPVVLLLSLDKLRVARTAVDLSAIFPWNGILTARIQGSFGLNALGARSAVHATELLPLSREGSDATFRKLEVSAQYDQPILPHLSLALLGRAQTAFDKAMANSEQFGIASPDGISTLDSGVLQGDAGYVVRSEMSAPFRVRAPSVVASLAPYMFAALGAVKYANPSIFEYARTNGSAWGAGLRFGAAGRSAQPRLSASIEYGRAHIQSRAGHSDRISFVTSMSL